MEKEKKCEYFNIFPHSVISHWTLWTSTVTSCIMHILCVWTFAGICVCICIFRCCTFRCTLILHVSVRVHVYSYR